jgi:hypothetical protein
VRLVARTAINRELKAKKERMLALYGAILQNEGGTLSLEVL